MKNILGNEVLTNRILYPAAATIYNREASKFPVLLKMAVPLGRIRPIIPTTCFKPPQSISRQTPLQCKRGRVNSSTNYEINKTKKEKKKERKRIRDKERKRERKTVERN